MTAPSGPAGRRAGCSRRSCCSSIPPKPASTAPMTMIRTPEAISSARRCWVSASPIQPAPAPRPVKTAPKPSTKAAVVRVTRRVWSARSLNETPGDVGEVGRHERPDAGRDERDHPGGERRAQPDGRERDLGEDGRHGARRRGRAARPAAAPPSGGRSGDRPPAPCRSRRSSSAWRRRRSCPRGRSTGSSRWGSASRPCARS